MLSNSLPKQLHQCHLCLYHELLITATWEALWWTWFVGKVKYVTKKEKKRLSRTSRNHQGDLAWIKAKLCKPCPPKGCSGQAWSRAWATFCKQRTGTIWLASLAVTQAPYFCIRSGTLWLIAPLLEQQLLLLLSHFSRVRLCATPQTAAHQASPSLGFSRQEHWSGLPFPSPMHESEKWKWIRSVVSDSSDPTDCSLPGSSVHGIF